GSITAIVLTLVAVVLVVLLLGLVARCYYYKKKTYFDISALLEPTKSAANDKNEPRKPSQQPLDSSGTDNSETPLLRPNNEIQHQAKTTSLLAPVDLVCEPKADGPAILKTDHTIGFDSEDTIRLGINDTIRFDTKNPAVLKTNDTICLEI
ncbi:hypothetical protein EGW08_016909, partial [Elysia chlorotica]